MIAGRPRKYETVEELEAVIRDFFLQCEETKTHPTVTGLAYALDLSRQGIINYAGRPEFVDTIKRAKLLIEAYIEQTLMEGKATAGAIFNLKNNFGWIDERVQENKGEIGVRSVTVKGV